METTEGEEVKLPGLLVSDWRAFHAPQRYSNCASDGMKCESYLPGPQKPGTGGTLTLIEFLRRPWPPADRSQMLGAVIGKALGSLDSGTGVIMVLVNVQ